MTALISGAVFGGPIIPGVNDDASGKSAVPQHAPVILPPLGRSAWHWAAIGDPGAFENQAGSATALNGADSLDGCVPLSGLAAGNAPSLALWPLFMDSRRSGRDMAVLGFHAPGHANGPFVTPRAVHALPPMSPLFGRGAPQGVALGSIAGAADAPSSGGGDHTSSAEDPATAQDAAVSQGAATSHEPMQPALGTLADAGVSAPPPPPPIAGSTPSPLVGDKPLDDLQLDALTDVVGRIQQDKAFKDRLGHVDEPANDLVAAVPLPAAVWMGLTGLAALIALRRRLL